METGRPNDSGHERSLQTRGERLSDCEKMAQTLLLSMVNQSDVIYCGCKLLSKLRIHFSIDSVMEWCVQSGV